MNRAYFNALKVLANKPVAFTMLVQSDNAGTSNDDQFTIPTSGGAVYNYIVKTSDGFLATGVTGSITITFPSGVGEHLVEITGVFPRIFFNNAGDRLKVKKVMPHWGVYGVGGGSQELAFFGCANLDEISAEGKWFDVVTDAFGMFSTCGLTSFPQRDMGACTNFRGAWRVNALTEFPLIDTSSGTNFERAWDNNNLVSFPLINTSNGTNFNFAWANNALTSFPLIDTSSATTLESTWDGNDLTEFQQINTSNVTTFFRTWRGNNLTTFPLIDTSLSTNFREAWSGNSLTIFPSINTSKGTNFNGTWENNALTSFPLIDTSSGTDFLRTWRNNNLTTWLPNFFDLCPATNYDDAFTGNALDADGVNNILISINKARVDNVSSGAGTLGIGGGTNAAPTGAGLTAKNELIAAGWTVTTN